MMVWFLMSQASVVLSYLPLLYHPLFLQLLFQSPQPLLPFLIEVFQFIRHTHLDIQFMVIPIIHPCHTTCRNPSSPVPPPVVDAKTQFVKEETEEDSPPEEIDKK